jgi:hypothetical protein
MLKTTNQHQDIVRKFEEGYYPWSRCFGKMFADSAMMPPEQVRRFPRSPKHVL